jgi:hypothetical protein
MQFEGMLHCLNFWVWKGKFWQFGKGNFDSLEKEKINDFFFQNSYTDLFLNYLWRKVTNINVAANYRMAAVGYLSSFLARAKYIPIKCVVFFIAKTTLFFN